MTWYLLHAARTENYMSIFFCSEDKRTCPDSQGKLKDGESKSNVAVFKIPNSHDYWNISMILNARTHQEFVEEPSVYAGKKDGK